MFRINLLEIPETGRDWTLNRRTGELNEVFKELIGDEAYEVTFTVTPLDRGTFQLVGTIKTAVPEGCSRCGEDFTWAVSENFKEMLLPGLDQPRNSQYAKVNHLSDQNNEGPSVFEYDGNHVNMGEYLHEIVALSLPSVPAPAVQSDGKCSLCQVNVKAKNFGYSEELPNKENPFAALKGWKN